MEKDSSRMGKSKAQGERRTQYPSECDTAKKDADEALTLTGCGIWKRGTPGRKAEATSVRTHETSSKDGVVDSLNFHLSLCVRKRCRN